MRAFIACLPLVLILFLIWLLSVVFIDLGPVSVAGYVIVSFILVLAAYGTFQFLVLRDYLAFGRLGTLASFFQLFIWGLFFCFPYLYNPPHWAWFWLHESENGSILKGVALFMIGVGLLALLVSMTGLGFGRTFCHKTDSLKQTGPYGLTRNPQLLACVPLVTGFALLCPSWFAFGWVALYGVISHLMVRTEEKHLEQVFGQEYRQYCASVPRYLRFPRFRKG